MVPKKDAPLKMRRLHIVIAMILVVAVAGTIVTVITLKRQPRIRIPEQVKAEIDHPEVGIRMVTLFFPTTDGSSIAATARPVEVTADEDMQLESVMEELLNVTREGLLPCLPESTRLRNLLIDDTGLAYVDLSREFLKNHPGGLTAEQSSINCLVLTLAANFPEITAVRILVDGSGIDTISGHIDASKPFLVDEIRRSANVR
jgi:spore germination protein GerM